MAPLFLRRATHVCVFSPPSAAFSRAGLLAASAPESNFLVPDTQAHATMPQPPIHLAATKSIRSHEYGLQIPSIRFSHRGGCKGCRSDTVSVHDAFGLQRRLGSQGIGRNAAMSPPMLFSGQPLSIFMVWNNTFLTRKAPHNMHNKALHFATGE